MVRSLKTVKIALAVGATFGTLDKIVTGIILTSSQFFYETNPAGVALMNGVGVWPACIAAAAFVVLLGAVVWFIAKDAAERHRWVFRFSQIWAFAYAAVFIYVAAQNFAVWAGV
jgi:hypothetical protein